MKKFQCLNCGFESELDQSLVSKMKFCPQCASEIRANMLHSMAPTSTSTSMGLAESIDKFIALVGGVLGLIALRLGGILMSETSKFLNYSSYGEPENMANAQFAAFLVFLSGIVILICSVGLFRSKSWAFWTILVTCGLLTPGLAESSPVTATYALLFSNYCILRLAGALGEKPK